MVESHLWIAHSNIQDSSFEVNSPCYCCGGKVHKASDCPSKKVAMNSNSNPNQNQNQNLARGKWYAPRNGEPDNKRVYGNFSSMTLAPNFGLRNLMMKIFQKKR